MGQTIAEKIFDSHRVDMPSEDIHVLKLDAVFCHEITTPIAITNLLENGKDRVFDSSKIKAVIDHVTPAKDSKTALQGKLLREWAMRNGIQDFFDDVVSLEALGVRSVAQQNTVSENVRCNGLDVFRNDGVAALHQGHGARHHHQRE